MTAPGQSMHHNQIIAVLREHGFAEGRMIANSKSGYCKRHRSHFVVFNAQVCSLRGRLLKQADLDLTLDGEKLTAGSARCGRELLRALREQSESLLETRFDANAPGPAGRGLVDADPSGGRGPLSPHEFWSAWRKSGFDCVAAWAVGKISRPTLWTCGTTRSGRAVATCPEQSFRCWATRPRVFGRRRKMRFSRLKSPKPGADLCVLCFTTAPDCWTMFGSVTAPPSRRSCMTTPSDSWIRLGLRGTGIVRPSICARRAKWWGCFGHATFLRRKFLPMRVRRLFRRFAESTATGENRR